MADISYDGYLTEQKLVVLCEEIFGEKVLTQYPLKYAKGRTAKVDIFVKSLNMAVEFDGDGHYRSAATIERDRAVDSYCEEIGIKIVHIPYWLQLDERVFFWAFGEEITKKYLEDQNRTVKTTFPNGFVSDKCLLPADFSISGWNRFAEEYQSFVELDTWSVMKEVWESLEIKIAKHGHARVMGDNPTNFTPGLFMEHYPT